MAAKATDLNTNVESTYFLTPTQEVEEVKSSSHLRPSLARNREIVQRSRSATIPSSKAIRLHKFQEKPITQQAEITKETQILEQTEMTEEAQVFEEKEMTKKFENRLGVSAKRTIELMQIELQKKYPGAQLNFIEDGAGEVKINYINSTMPYKERQNFVKDAFIIIEEAEGLLHEENIFYDFDHTIPRPLLKGLNFKNGQASAASARPKPFHTAVTKAGRSIMPSYFNLYNTENGFEQLLEIQGELKKEANALVASEQPNLLEKYGVELSNVQASVDLAVELDKKLINTLDIPKNLLLPLADFNNISKKVQSEVIDFVEHIGPSRSPNLSVSTAAKSLNKGLEKCEPLITFYQILNSQLPQGSSAYNFVEIGYNRIVSGFKEAADALTIYGGENLIDQDRLYQYSNPAKNLIRDQKSLKYFE